MRDLYAFNDGPILLNDLIALNLSPELEKSLESGELSIKANNTETYICTASKTFRLSGASCNPTQCLMGQDKEDMDAYCLGTSIKSNLVADECPGWIDWESVPAYGVDGFSKKETLEDLMKRSFCSKKEFETFWTKRGGVVIDGYAGVPDDDLVFKAAIELNSGVFEHGEDPELVLESCQGELPRELYTAVYHRFWPGVELATWVGVRLLHEMSRPTVDEFISRWKRDLLGVNVSLDMLAGHHVVINDRMAYVDPAQLPTKPTERFSTLFRMKKEWEISQLVHFLGDFVDTSEPRSVEVFIKKYAKVVNSADPHDPQRMVKRVRPLK